MSSDPDTHNDEDLLEFTNELRERPYDFGLFATMRRFECGAAGKPRFGLSLRPVEDPIRLGQNPTLAFAASQLSELEPGRGRIPPRLAVFGPGLFGPQGALPIHITEYVSDRMRNHDDFAMWRFYDLFHHRMLSLLYRAWGNAQPAVNADRPEDDRFTTYVASLMGMGLETLRDRDGFPDHARLHYVGHFARQSRSPEGLIGALRDFFDVDVQLQQFIGEWLVIPEAAHWRLGERRHNAGLGLGTTIGASVWGCQHKFRLTLGPLDFASFQRFLPGTDTVDRLVAIVRSFCGDEYDWDLKLVLKKDEVPAVQLGQQGLLGRTSWMDDRQRERDAEDACLRPLDPLWHANAA